ncbi:Zinc finger and SCAN domain-containing protein 5B [Trapelia coarctata]|nr:Zinc finger and SCAN domain-containing protein 5B [Trapelia coarctata]
MEVINASGRKVSLLNDEPPAYFSGSRPHFSDHSRKSSYSTQMSRDDSESSQYSSLASPAYSPRPTPQLLRFDSTSSQGTLTTPSPMTPTYPFDPLDQNKNVPREPYYRSNGPYYAPQPQEGIQQPYYNLSNRNDLLMEDVYPSLGPPLQTQFQYPVPESSTPISPQSSLQTPVAATPSSLQSASAPNTNGSKIGKKKYPCPHAVRYSCTDTFTTSGHAARHGKKHTGEKNIFCPTCNKAFTRKDNMKQHERTHKVTGRDAAPSSPTPTNTPARRAKASKTQSSTAESTPQISADVEMEEQESGFLGDATIRATRPQMRRTGLTEELQYSHANSNISIDTTLAENSRPNFERKFSGGSQDGEGESPGLDALAMAASGLSG